MSKELTLATGTTGQTITASVYLLGVAKATGIACAEIGVTGVYAGDFTASPNAAGVYHAVFFAGGTVAVGAGQIAWDGAAEVLPTGDSFARLGAPAGASISADIAAVQAKTVNLPAAPASTTNIAAGTITTVTTLTNLPAITAGWLTATGIAAAALNGKGDWSTVAPTNLTAAQIATGIFTDTTASDFTAANSVGKSIMNGVALGTGLTINGYTGNTVQTGDSYVRIGAAGAGLTALGDTRIANLDATVSSRTKPADTQAAVTLVATTTAVTNDVGVTQAGADKVWGSAARTLTSFGTLVADAAAAVWSSVTRVLTAGTNIVLAKGTGVTGFNDIAATAIVSGGAITTSSGVAQANIKAVNDVIITGTGVANTDEWRPV